MTISGELSTLIPVLFPCATAAPLKNDTGTGIGFPHGGRGPTAAVRGRCFRILCAVGSPSGPNDGMLCRSLSPLGPPADPTTDCLACAVESPSGPNDGMLCRCLVPLGPPADPTTECLAGACEVVESPSGPNGFAPASRDLAEAGRLTAGVPGSAGQGLRRAGGSSGAAGAGCSPTGADDVGPAAGAAKEAKGCRNTGSGRWRPSGGLLNDCWRALNGSPIGRALWKAETAN